MLRSFAVTRHTARPALQLPPPKHTRGTRSALDTDTRAFFNPRRRFFCIAHIVGAGVGRWANRSTRYGPVHGTRDDGTRNTLHTHGTRDGWGRGAPGARSAPRCAGRTHGTEPLTMPHCHFDRCPCRIVPLAPGPRRRRVAPRCLGRMLLCCVCVGAHHAKDHLKLRSLSSARKTRQTTHTRHTRDLAHMPWRTHTHISHHKRNRRADGPPESEQRHSEWEGMRQGGGRVLRSL
jgi:hypothetical protein